MLCEIISRSAALLGKGYRETAQCLMVGAESGNRPELTLIAFSFLFTLV